MLIVDLNSVYDEDMVSAICEESFEVGDEVILYDYEEITLIGTIKSINGKIAEVKINWDTLERHD